MITQLTAEARAARRQYFLGSRPNAQLAAFFDAFDNVVPPEMRGVRAQAKGDDLEINCLDVIGYDFWTGGGITAKSFKRILDDHQNAKRIRVVINSPGGICDEGIAVYNSLKRHKAKITTEVIGIAASIASVIFMAGTTREMHTGTQLMIHRAMRFTMGNEEDHEQSVQSLRSYDDSIRAIYLEHVSGLSEDEVREMVRAETYISAADALSKGFATAVLSAPPKTIIDPETPEEQPREDLGAEDIAPAMPAVAALRAASLVARTPSQTTRNLIQ